MKIITLKEANEKIKEVCESYGINIIQYQDDSYLVNAEGDSDVAAYNIKIKHDLENQADILTFNGRIRVMPNNMTPEELYNYADKCIQVARSIEELNYIFKNLLVKKED